MKKLLGLVVAFLLGGSVMAQTKRDEQSAADKLGWQLGVHSYTFLKFSIDDAIDKTQSLGLRYMSISGSVSLDGKTRMKTTDLSAEQLDSLHKKLSAAGLTLLNMGVVQLPANEAESRKVFEFAKKLGIDTLVSEPEPDALDTVEKLCKEYNIKVAIHNHSQPTRYWNPDTVLAAIKNRSPLLGVCADTGHWILSGVDPVEAVKKLEGRILCFHFKDENERGPKGHDVPWGTGVGNIKGVLTEMKRQNFHGAFLVEYEHNWENSVPEIAECVKYFNTVCAELTASAANAPIPLWSSAAPGETGDIGDEHDTTKPTDNLIAGKPVIRLGNVSKPTITFYPAQKNKNTGAAVVVCPGGGYHILAMDLEGTEVCDWLNSIGVNAVLLKYRVPARKNRPRYEAPLQDAQRAVGLVRHRAQEWGIDPKRIGILGFSAGAHLAAALSANSDPRAYDPLYATDRLSCRPDFALLIYPGGFVKKEEPDKLAPELAVTANTPPTFLVQTEDDDVRVENSLAYYQALKKMKIPVEMHLYPTGGHGYGLRHVDGKPVTDWPRLAEQWMTELGVFGK